MDRDPVLPGVCLAQVLQEHDTHGRVASRTVICFVLVSDDEQRQDSS
jgi:hypothetical protein